MFTVVFVVGFAFGAIGMFTADRTIVPWLAHKWATRRRAHGWR
jgi:hypothetical protein